MRILYFVFCIVLFVSQKTSAQINWGDTQQSNHTGSDHIGVRAENEQCIYMIKKDKIVRENELWYLEAISKQDKKSAFSKLLINPATPDKKPVNWNTLITLGTKLYLISSHFDITGLYNIYATSINTVTGNSEETKLIYSTIIREKGTPYFRYALSPDKNKMFICSVPFNIANNEAKIIDENLVDVWKGLIATPTEPLPFNYYYPLLDNNNNVFLYTVNFIGKTPTDPKIILFATTTGKSNILNIQMPSDAIPYSETLKLFDDNKLYFVALLYNKDGNGFKQTCGTLSAIINTEEQEFLNAETNFFDQQKTDELSGVTKNWIASFSSLYFIKDVFFRNNGTITLITEQKTIAYSRHYTMIEEGYAQGLILAVNLSMRGYINWYSIISKDQTYPIKEYLSFISAYDDNTIYLVFNDNYKNTGIDNQQRPKCMENPHEAVVFIVSIDNYGTLTKKPLYSVDDVTYLPLKPILCSKLKSNSLLLFTEKENSFRLGEVTLK